MHSSTQVMFSILIQSRIPCLGDGDTHNGQIFPPQLLSSGYFLHWNVYMPTKFREALIEVPCSSYPSLYQVDNHSGLRRCDHHSNCSEKPISCIKKGFWRIQWCIHSWGCLSCAELVILLTSDRSNVKLPWGVP